MAKLPLDVSELEAPQPLLKALQKVRELREGDFIEMIHRLRPCYLFDSLDGNGYFYRVVKKGELVVIYICFENDKESKKEIELLCEGFENV